MLPKIIGALTLACLSSTALAMAPVPSPNENRYYTYSVPTPSSAELRACAETVFGIYKKYNLHKLASSNYQYTDAHNECSYILTRGITYDCLDHQFSIHIQDETLPLYSIQSKASYECAEW